MKVSEIRRRMKRIDAVAQELENAVNDLRQQFTDDGDDAAVSVYVGGVHAADDYLTVSVSARYTQTF